MQIENIEALLFGYLFSGFGLSIILALIIVVPLHISLCKRLDPLLFKEPYFQQSELGIYNSWPLSIIRSTSYMLLITWPKLVKKRFNKLNTDIYPNPLEYYGSFLYLIAIAVAIGSLGTLLLWLLADIVFG
ncbi:hypothetical protein KOI40_02050 [Aestuariicella sp. G3-2]|uniref:hypothetical protein n=1 Tax=Pseudomaricurvus albidus TaxID=2842452 RepID=UPI001C0D152B|nr:hypothetical protein [Aestuariicella albida]MBU3068580.1 hypothetical protein [Aestuariicella albida]